MGRQEQIEHEFDHRAATDWGNKPWGKCKRSHKFTKKLLHRRERRRSKDDPECGPEYRKYEGYEW